uniref:Uncharacterized protein n=1 Tax=Xiphophorus maculatus TaxID=8083 RepID=A0A3B5R2P7_XIPMA
ENRCLGRKVETPTTKHPPNQLDQLVLHIYNNYIRLIIFKSVVYFCCDVTVSDYSLMGHRTSSSRALGEENAMEETEQFI